MIAWKPGRFNLGRSGQQRFLPAGDSAFIGDRGRHQTLSSSAEGCCSESRNVPGTWQTRMPYQHTSPAQPPTHLGISPDSVSLQRSTMGRYTRDGVSAWT